MEKVAIVGSGIGVRGVGIAGGVRLFARLAAALGAMAVTSQHTTPSGLPPKTRRAVRSYQLGKGGTIKTIYPGQSDEQRDYLLARAEAKRARKSLKRAEDLERSVRNNRTHFPVGKDGWTHYDVPMSPFYIAR